MSKISFILVDWSEYLLYRQKKLAQVSKNTIFCGLGAILDNTEKYSVGTDFEVTVILTGI